MSILVLDNYDSFAYNLVQYVREVTGEDVAVARNDRIELDAIEDFDAVVLSPGPGLPADAGIMPALVRRYSHSKRILGICLGHQCIAECFGASLENMAMPCHGVSNETEVVEPGHYLFRGIPSRFPSGRYHSWTVSSSGFPASLKRLAADRDGRVMGLAHAHFDVCGVQFHPESVLTPWGKKLLANWARGRTT